MIDRIGRTIDIALEEDGIAIAKHSDREVGRIEVLHVEIDASKGCWSYRLNDMNVEEEYRRAGIGTALMRAIVERIGSDFDRPSLLASGGSQKQAYEYYTVEGCAFMQIPTETGHGIRRKLATV